MWRSQTVRLHEAKCPLSLEFGAEATPSSGVLWQIDVTKPPVGDSDKQWSGMAEGDLVVFPSLLTGAGEFEAVRVIGPTNGDRPLTLLPLGVEYPEFPTVISGAILRL